MQLQPHPFNSYRRYAALMLTLLTVGHMACASAQSQAERQRRYQADRKDCLRGNTSQVVDSCLKEAGALLYDKSGAQPSVGADELQRNSLKRCEVFQGDERTACVARMQGQSTVSGNVAGGGLLREQITVEKAASAPVSTEPAK